MSKDTKHIRNRDAWKARALAYERAIRITLRLHGSCTDETMKGLRRVMADHATCGTVTQDDVDISGASEGVKK